MDIKREYDTEIGPTQVVFQIVDVPNPSEKKIAMWSESESQQLMNLYEEYITQIGPQQRFMHKKDMWTEIATHFEGRHRKQCEERYKTVLRRKKRHLLETDDLETEEWEQNPFEMIEKFEDEGKVEETTKPFRHVHMWTNNETKLLMSLYRTLIWDVGKRFTFQKEMWREIATHFPDKNPNQCEQRYKTVLKRKKKVVLTRAKKKLNDFKNKDYVGRSVLKNNRINKTKVNKTETVDVDDTDMTELLTLGEEVINEPEKVEISMENISAPEISQTTTTNEQLSRDRKDFRLPEILWEIATKKEEAKERRHRERMEATKQLQNILQQILNSKNS